MYCTNASQYYIYCINLSPTYFCDELFQLSAFISDKLYRSYESEPSPSIPEAESTHSDKPDPDAEDCDSESSEGTLAASQCGCGSCEHGPGDPHQICNGAHYLCYKCSATCGGDYWVCELCYESDVHTTSAGHRKRMCLQTDKYCTPLNS